MAQQLTETLRSAHGPPATDAADDSAATTSKDSTSPQLASIRGNGLRHFALLSSSSTILINGSSVPVATGVPLGDLTAIVANTNASAVGSFFETASDGSQASFIGSITIADQLIGGTFTLKLESGQVTGGVSSATASLMSDDAGVEITGGTGGFVLTSEGTALSVEGDAEFLGMPGLLMDGTLTVRINTLASPPASAVVPDPANPGSTKTVTFDFSGANNAFEGSPSIQVLQTLELGTFPLVDVTGATTIADNGAGVLVFNYAENDLVTTIAVAGIELLAFNSSENAPVIFRRLTTGDGPADGARLDGPATGRVHGRNQVGNGLRHAAGHQRHYRHAACQ